MSIESTADQWAEIERMMEKSGLSKKESFNKGDLKIIFAISVSSTMRRFEVLFDSEIDDDDFMKTFINMRNNIKSFHISVIDDLIVNYKALNKDSVKRD